MLWKADRAVTGRIELDDEIRRGRTDRDTAARAAGTTILRIVRLIRMANVGCGGKARWKEEVDGMRLNARHHVKAPSSATIHLHALWIL